MAHRIVDDLSKGIDIFEAQIHLRKRGKIEEELFAETRLRCGAYGQLHYECRYTVECDETDGKRISLCLRLEDDFTPDMLLTNLVA